MGRYLDTSRNINFRTFTEKHHSLAIMGQALSLLFYEVSLCSRSNPNEGGRPAISAYWADYTQVQLSVMMATIPHCHRQPIFIEQSEAILAGPRETTHLPTWRYFFKH